MKQQYTFSKIYSLLPFLLASFLWFGGSSAFAQTTETFTTDGTWTVPCGVTSVTVELWGAGGGGGRANDGIAGGGGGGGYVQVTFSVTPGQNIPYNVGTIDDPDSPGADGSAGGGTVGGGSLAGYDGWYSSFLDAVAQGGEGGNGTNTGGAGGAGGGLGSAGPNTGGSGTSITIINGANGADGSAGGAGGDAGNAPGTGGAGPTPGTDDSNPGISPGGGGSGASDTGGGSVNGPDGAGGQIVLTYTATLPTSPNAGTDQVLAACATTATLAGNTPDAGTTATWTVSPAGPTIADPNDPNSGVTGLVPGTSYTFTWTFVTPGCTNETSTVTIDAVEGIGCWTYCTSTWSDPDDEYISAVTFGTINETLGTGGYSDNTGSCTDVSPGETVQLCVDITTNALALTNDVFVFFDWNNDGDFLDANESYDFGSFSAASSTTQICNDITIPAGATIGSTVFRIITAEGGDPGPCDSGNFGDAADFCVNINNCTTTAPLAGTDQLLASCVTSTTLAGNTISQGTGTWSLAGGSGIITDPSNPTSGVTSLGAGQNFFVWTVDDAPCPTLTDTVIIETQDTPTPANAGADQDGCVGGVFTMDGNNPGAGETGSWSCTSGCAGVVITTPSDPNTTVTLAGIPGTTATLTWTIDNGTCTHSDDMVLTVIAAVTAANAGGDQSACEGVPITLAGNTPTNGTGTWSVASGVNFTDVNDPSSTATGLTPGTYTVTWTISGAGCISSSDDMIFTVDPCDPNVIYDVCSNGGYTFTDGAGAYSNDEHIVQTYCSDDAANPYITATFSEFDLYSSLDYMTIIDGDGTGDPFIWSSTTNGAPTTITSSNPDGCLTFVFMSNGSNTDPGFTAAISCAAAAGSNTSVCNDSDCQGGCGRTICGDGTYEWAGDGISMPELNTANNDCLNANEQCNVWYYINPASVPPGGGDLSLNIVSNGGQDQDFAVWEGFNSTLDCPVVSQDQPIACNWVAMNNSGTGTGFSDDYPDAWHAPSLQISEQDIANGIYYMVLINTYNNGGACPQTSVELTFGGTALLSCEPLGVTIADIRGVAHDEYNYVYWETMNEYNCESFTLERSKNMVDWEDVGTLQGAGTSDRSLYYSMKDYNRENPVTYYRLRQKDFDGEQTYSKVISVSTLQDEESWITNLFPNPANESFTFQYNGNNQEEALEVYVFDMLGRQVVSQEFILKKHDANVVNTQHLENGQYRAVFIQGQKRTTQSFTILR